jgi:hypothetical protein
VKDIEFNELGGIIVAEETFGNTDCQTSAPVCRECAPEIPSELDGKPLRDQMRFRLNKIIPLGPRLIGIPSGGDDDDPPAA